MSAHRRLAACDALLAAALEEARARGLFLIGRLQDRRDWGLLAQNGSLERVIGARSAGFGVQVFTPGGHCGFASTDLLTPNQARQAVRRAGDLARAAAAAGGETTDFAQRLDGRPTAPPLDPARCLEATPRAERQEALLAAHRRALELGSGFAVSSSFSLVDDEWRVARSDGLDVSYRLARAMVRHAFTARGGDQAASASASVSGSDDRVLLDPNCALRLERRAAQAVQRARDVVGAATVRGGSYRIVLDYSMAKGLAHEAFGHAAESDVAASSILATGGRLRLGERVAPSDVSIVDGPVPGDYAYQPVSANGLPRETVAIIRQGTLHSGLGDLFSAKLAGTPVTGAARAESFRSRPLPRISNIRLVLDRFAPLDQPPELLTPLEVRERLAAVGLLDGRQPTLYLAGYRGGQVAPLTGDFVFNCSVIYDLTDGAAPHRPAIFSGKSLSALGAIVGALGDLQLDAPGQCVKGSQAVPSSGGSHAFVVLEPHPEVTVGG